MYSGFTLLSMLFVKLSVCLRTLYSSFNVLFSLFARKLSKMKTRKNCADIAEVMNYRDIDGLSIPRQSVGGNRRLKKNATEGRPGNSKQVWGYKIYRWTIISTMDRPAHP